MGEWWNDRWRGLLPSVCMSVFLNVCVFICMCMHVLYIYVMLCWMNLKITEHICEFSSCRKPYQGVAVTRTKEVRSGEVTGVFISLSLSLFVFLQEGEKGKSLMVAVFPFLLKSTLLLSIGTIQKERLLSFLKVILLARCPTANQTWSLEITCGGVKLVFLCCVL